MHEEDALRGGRWRNAKGPGKRPTGTPRPWTFKMITAGILARESLQSSGLPTHKGSGMSGWRLFAYSCGGSVGLVASDCTNFPLSPRYWVSGEP